MDAARVPLDVPAEAPLALVAVEAPAAAAPAVSVAPRARSAPLNLLFSVLLI